MDQVAPNEYSIEGTPADAVILAFNAILKEKPDLVVSGINRGGNMGENIYYSGTVGAAMEGAINRVPSIAISVAYRSKDFDFKPAAQFARTLIPLILTEGLPTGYFVERECSAKMDRRGAFHAAILEDHPQRAAARRRSPRPQIFLAARTAAASKTSSRIPISPLCATAQSPSLLSNSITRTANRSSISHTGPSFWNPSSRPSDFRRALDSFVASRRARFLRYLLSCGTITSFGASIGSDGTSQRNSSVAAIASGNLRDDKSRRVRRAVSPQKCR